MKYKLCKSDTILCSPPCTLLHYGESEGGLGVGGLYLKQNILTIRAFTIYPFLIFAPFKYLLVISLLVIGLQNPDNHSFVKKHNLN